VKNLSLDCRQVREVEVHRINGSATRQERDLLAAEEPLEIRIEGKSVAVVMRTPGEDRELVAGFLVTEGLVHSAGDLVAISHSPHCWVSTKDTNDQSIESNGALEGKAPSSSSLREQSSGNPPTGAKASLSEGNLINVKLCQPQSLDLKKLTRHVFSSSSCGICSKASIDAVRQQFPPIQDDFELEPQVLLGMPAALASAQATFKRTGGLHACALFDLAGNLLVVREDVGRHNALDKVVGWALLRDRLPLRRHLLLLSGRTSFEMMQKALAAGVPVVAAISAPSSLAVEFARESGQTLVGFLRGERMNVYSGAERFCKIDALPSLFQRHRTSERFDH
jgi:FdhD protein